MAGEQEQKGGEQARTGHTVGHGGAQEGLAGAAEQAHGGHSTADRHLATGAIDDQAAMGEEKEEHEPEPLDRGDNKHRGAGLQVAGEQGEQQVERRVAGQPPGCGQQVKTEPAVHWGQAEVPAEDQDEQADERRNGEQQEPGQAAGRNDDRREQGVGFHTAYSARSLLRRG